MATSGELLTSALGVLGPKHPSARLDAEVLLAHTLDKPRTHLHAWPDHPVADDRTARYRELVARRAGGEPVAYLIGTREFWSLSLEVTPETLIPRPETELLVEVALSLIPAGERMPVADLGTGTGAVAAAVASERPACAVLATDVSPRALEVAARNMARLGLGNVRLRRGDWCEALAGERFALIVSNPPYVARADAHLDQGDVRFEPRMALCAGDDGLDAIRAIAATAAAHLLPGGALVVEHGHDQGPAVLELFAHGGYRDVRSHRDLAGNDRVVVGTRSLG
jgi:release factor glutamine methyltransferase